MHVAIVNPGAGIGGAEISLLELLGRLGGEPRVTVVLPEDGPLRERAAAVGAAVRIVPWPASFLGLGERAGVSRSGLLAAAAVLPRTVGALVRDLRAVAADVIVTNGIKAHVLGALAGQRLGLPVVWYARDGLEGRRVSSVLLRLAGRRCAGAVAISRYVAAQWKPVVRAGAPIPVVYNIVDLQRHRPGVAAAADLAKPAGEVWFGVVGALTPLKGQDLFIEAAARVLREFPAARFLVIGDNFYHSETRLGFDGNLREQAQRLGIAREVRFLGRREDMPAVLAALDVLVQPNRGPEGLGRSILEAMASGVAVLAVDRWGPAEIVRDGETGLLFPWSNVPALGRSMVCLARDSGLRMRLVRNARSWVETTLAPDAIVAQFRAALESILAGSGARCPGLATGAVASGN